MSSTIELYSPNKPAHKTTSARSIWGRMLWKDAREVMPIWVTLLSAATLCLAVTLWMVNSKIAHIAPLYISGHTFIALISVITGVFLLASENENRTVYLLRNLPLPPKQIIWQKLMLGGVGVIVLACCIAIITMLLASFAGCKPLESGSTFRFTFANVFLLPLFYLVVALLSSMITRSHFYGVLIAGTICVSAIAFLEPTWLGARGSNLTDRDALRWLWVALTTVAGVCGLVLGANGWIEENAVSKPNVRSLQSTKTQTGRRSIATSPNPLPVLIWQSFRQSRTLLICFVGLLFIGWITIMVYVDYSGQWDSASDVSIAKTMLTLPWTLAVMAMFASAIFLDDKRQGNYLFFQQNRERSKWFWLSRLLPFCSAALLVVAFWNVFVFDIGESFIPFDHYRYYSPRLPQLLSSIGAQIASQAFLVPLLAMLGIIGIGQYFSMFVRNPILSFIFTGIISVIFVLLASYVVFVNESVWLFIVPTIVAGYLATWWRSKFWLATSQHTRYYFMPIMLPVIVFAIVAASFISHRATEFGDVRFDANNFAEWNHGRLVDVQERNIGLQRVEFGTEAQRQQAATLYREAFALFERTDWSADDLASIKVWPAEHEARFISLHKVAINKIIEASLLPACNPFVSDDPETRGNEQWTLKQMALASSRHQLSKSNLPAAKRSIEAYDRVLQRVNDRTSSTRYDSGYYGLLIAWADHPAQKLSAITNAIALLEGSDSDIRPTEIVNGLGSVVEPDSVTGMNVSRLYRVFGGERAFMNLQHEILSLQKDNLNHGIAELKPNFRLMPWEYRRQLKVGQLRAIREFDLDQTLINSYALGNSRLINLGKINNDASAIRHWPPIPIDEDRTGFSRYFSTFGTVRSLLEDTNWRRYTLLRMGLAAYKIEHEQYPDELLQLESYYKHDLPTTTDGRMFGWFKDGLGADLINAEYKDVGSDELKSADKIADEGSPLLLPFSVNAARPLPEPIDYDEGKLGIDFRSLPDKHSYYVVGYHYSPYFKIDWTVGGKTESSDSNH